MLTVPDNDTIEETEMNAYLIDAAARSHRDDLLREAASARRTRLARRFGDEDARRTRART